MTSTTVTNIQELKIEIIRLKALDSEQTTALKMRFSSPSAIFASALTLFPRSAATSGVLNAGLFKQDFLSLISRFLIPLTLNKTVFRHSNFLVKLMVGLVSQKASGYVTESAVEKVIREGKSLIGKLFHKKAAIADGSTLQEIKPAL